MIQVSAKHQMVGVPYSAALANLFPEAKTLTLSGNDLIVLPHNFTSTLLLRNMGVDVPAPVLHHYDWNGGDPFEVQKKTVALMTTHQRAYVLNGMGTGKTKAALWACDYLMKAGVAKKALIVAPLSTLNFTWGREIFQTLPARKFRILHGTRQKRQKLLAEDVDFYIINPDGVATVYKDLEGRTDIDTLVIDELATFRNMNTRTKTMAALAKRMVWAWGMTGSPTPNEPTDAFGQCKVLTPHTVPKYFGRFRDQVMNKISQFKYAPKRDANETVFQVMQPAVRFTLDDVVELPEVVERTVDIDLGSRQKEVYEQLRKHAYALAETGEITAVNAGAVLSKLLQVSLGYVYAKDRSVVALDNDLRIRALVDAIESTDRKVLVFVPFKHALDGIAAALTREGIDHAVISGDTPKKDRDETFALFQNTSKIRVIAAHPATMSHGLTLTAADTVIWFGPTTSLEIFEQANARIRRIGQKHRQLILMFQSTPAEKRIYSRLRAKQAVQGDLLNMFAEAQL